jgi:ATP-binding cassette subfamily B protein
MIPRAQASADRINEVLLTVPSITDPKEPQKDSGLRGYVEFQDVTFRYAGAEKPVLENITFKAKPGETSAIIGRHRGRKNDDSSIDPEIFRY